MNPAPLILTGIGAAIASALILLILLKSGLAARLAMDQPNARSMHVHPTPRCGGIAVVAVSVVALLLQWPGTIRLLLGVVILAVMSWIDDRQGVPILVRFALHGAVALLVVLGVSLNSWISIPIAVLAIMWGTNLFNFMDGANGMSASMLVAGFASYAAAAYRIDDPLALLCATVAGAGVGFWYFNRTPAQLFLGDVGSIPSGFLMACIGLIGWCEGAWPFWFPWLVFSPFVADATATLLRRALRGEAVWRAHREHFYQRMVRSGASHEATSLRWFGLSLIAGALAVVLRNQSSEVVAAGIGGYALLLVATATSIELRFRRVGGE